MAADLPNMAADLPDMAADLIVASTYSALAVSAVLLMRTIEDLPADELPNKAGELPNKARELPNKAGELPNKVEAGELPVEELHAPVLPGSGAQRHHKHPALFRYFFRHFPGTVQALFRHVENTFKTLFMQF